MKPLPAIIKLIKEVSVYSIQQKQVLTSDMSISPQEHRNLLVQLAENQDGCFLQLKDGTFLKVIKLSNDDIQIEKIEPFYEFDDENEIKMYLTTDNEVFENFLRWQTLKNILDEEDKPLI